MKYYRCRSCDEVYPESRLWTKPIEMTDGCVIHAYYCSECEETAFDEITKEEYDKQMAIYAENAKSWKFIKEADNDS